MNRGQTGSFIVFEVLKYFNVKDIFGYPGGAIMPLYDELLKNPQITHYTSATEQGATHSASGYARVSDSIGVVFSTSGPGATNTVTGIADAKLDSIPMVVITANVASHLIGSDAFQEVDICSITKVITKKNFFVNKIEDLQKSLFLAFKISKNKRPGPVLVDITKDVLMSNYKIQKFEDFNDLSYE